MLGTLAAAWDAGLSFLAGNFWALAITVVLTALMLQPLCNFLLYGWVRKAEEVNSSLTTDAKKAYLKVFWFQDVADDKVEKEFSDLYQRWYGRRRFAVPLFLVLLIAVFEVFFLAKELIQLVSNAGELHASTAAIAGAYTFVTWDFFGRVQRRSLTSTDILRGALRLAMAVPVGFAFAALLDRGFAPFLAFAVGVFPLETISTILRRLANDKLKVELGANAAPDQLATLSGIDRSVADRIEEADITTIPQLAWCDPIQLTMRTNLSFDYVVDVVGQALAWVYLCEKLPILRTFGLRSAYEIHVFMKELGGDDPATKAKAAGVLAAAAKAIEFSQEGLEHAFAQIAEDKATEFLYLAS